MSFLLGKAYQQVSRRAREALAPFGVTPVQFATLSVLWQRDGLSSADLGQRLLLDSATMTGILDRLEQAGLIARRPDPEGDRRINRIHLTAEGLKARGPMNEAMDRLNRDIDAELAGGDAAFRAALAALVQGEANAR